MTDVDHRQAAIDAAVKVNDDFYDRDLDVLYPADAMVRELATRMVDAAAPHLAAGERAKLYAELGNEHYVIFTEDRWTVEHSVECKLGGHMHECRYHEAVAGIAEDYDPGMLGRWRITDIDSKGLPSLERQVPDALAAKLTALGVPPAEQAMYAHAIRQDPGWRERLAAVTTREQLDHYTETGAIAP